jgi:hypothetical protein
MSLAINDNRPAFRPTFGARPAGPQPFASAEAAWFWTMQMLAARRDGAGARFGTGGIRPCEPDDVVQVLDRLYRQRRIDLAHARILRIYGERGTRPNEAVASERADARLWCQALDRMERPLRDKGIVR